MSTLVLASEIRSHWFAASIRECQFFVGRIMLMRDAREIVASAEGLASTLAAPETPAEELLQRGLLVEIAAKWGTLVHRRAHDDDASQCCFVPHRALDPFWMNRSRATQAFTDWSRSFSDEFDRVHRLSSAQEAALLIRRDYTRLWTATQIAREIGINASHLRRTFRREYGVDIAACIRHARLLHALERLTESGGKIEPIALEVGYRSKKNLYHAFKTRVGITPAAFRQLPSDAARQLIESVRGQLNLSTRV